MLQEHDRVLPSAGQVTTLSFYELGNVNFSENQDSRPNTSLAREVAFALTVNGDLNGLIVLSCDGLPSKDDLSSGLELLNVLAARVIQELEDTGHDLIMGPPERLNHSLLTRVLPSGSRAKHHWSGSFSGTTTFDFELFLTTEVTTLESITDPVQVIETADRETESCLEPYSQS